jgi:hypothetical protein
MDPMDEKRIASVYRHARVLSQTRDEFGQVVLEAEASARALLAIA